jgi:hypothetical protein
VPYLLYFSPCVQNRATRLILGRDTFYYKNGVKYRHDADVRNHMCKIPCVSDVLYRQDVVFLHKCMSGAVDLPVFTENRVSVRSKPAMLRGSKSTEFVVPRLNVLYYNNSFFPRSVGLYNKLNENVKSMS